MWRAARTSSDSLKDKGKNRANFGPPAPAFSVLFPPHPQCGLLKGSDGLKIYALTTAYIFAALGHRANICGHKFWLWFFFTVRPAPACASDLSLGLGGQVLSGRHSSVCSCVFSRVFYLAHLSRFTGQPPHSFRTVSSFARGRPRSAHLPALFCSRSFLFLCRPVAIPDRLAASPTRGPHRSYFSGVGTPTPRAAAIAACCSPHPRSVPPLLFLYIATPSMRAGPPLC